MKNKNLTSPENSCTESYSNMTKDEALKAGHTIWVDKNDETNWGILPAKNKPEAMIGIGGAPTRATTLPEGAEDRKKYPIASGFMDYFPDAITAISHISWKGNDQHNPGQPLHWARGKSADEADTMLRHFLQRGTIDTDGVRHSAKMAWRALALLQKEIEEESK